MCTQLYAQRSDLLVNLKYKNTLPDVPFDLKFIRSNSAKKFHQLAEYKPTSLELNYQYDNYAELDLGVPIDLIDQDVYRRMANDGVHHSTDEKLLEDDVPKRDSTRSKQHKTSVSWLRRSEYISTEQTRFQPQSIEKHECKVGANLKKSLMEATLYMDRSSQIHAIRKTFADSKKGIINHYRF